MVASSRSRTPTAEIQVNPEYWRALSVRGKHSMTTALQELYAGEDCMVLNDGDIGDAGLCLFAEAMVALQSLRTLNLGKNRIGDEGAKCLAAALPCHPGLQVLCLAFNRIGDEGAAALARAIEQHPSLRIVSLEDNAMTDVGALQLIAALASQSRTGILCPIAGNPVRRMSSKALDDLGQAASTVRKLSDRGIKLGQLLKIYAAGCADGTIQPDESTTSEVVMGLILPASAPARQSYVEAFVPSNPRPGIHVIHAWGGLFRELLSAIASHATGEANPSLELSDPLWVFDTKQHQEKSYFLDIFCVNQHATINAYRKYGLSDNLTYPVGDPYCQIDKFPLVADQIQRRGGVTLLVVDAYAQVFKRVQCLKEVHEAIVSNSRVDTYFCALPTSDDEKLSLPLDQAQAACNGDRDPILEDINALPGGLEQFDREVEEFIALHMEEHRARAARPPSKETRRGTVLAAMSRPKEENLGSPARS